MLNPLYFFKKVRLLIIRTRLKDGNYQKHLLFLSESSNNKTQHEDKAFYRNYQLIKAINIVFFIYLFRSSNGQSLDQNVKKTHIQKSLFRSSY
jgi:hypothetical protein